MIFKNITNENSLLLEAKETLKRFDIQELFLEYTVYNTSANAPYHNMIHVSAMIVAAGKYEKCTRELLTAIVFHDFNHSAGELPDRENITSAKAAYDCYCFDWVKRSMIVMELISATQYPYVSEAYTEEQKLIRDLDLSMPLLPVDVSVKLFKGLAEEMKISDMNKFSAGVKEFYGKIEIKSEFGKANIKPYLKECVDKLYGRLA